MRETLIVILNEREGSAAVMENTVKCHPERQRRIYYRSEEGGMKIKAISCELNILLRFESLRQASIFNRTACASELLSAAESMVLV